MSCYILEMLLEDSGFLLLLTLLSSLLFFVFAFHQCCRCWTQCWTWPRQVSINQRKIPLPPEPSVQTSWWWWRCPIFGHIRELGVSPHRRLVEFDQHLGLIGALSLQLASKRAVVINGSAAVRVAASKLHLNPRLQSPFDDRPDFTAFRWYALGRSLSFARDGPALRAHRRVAAASIAKLIGDAGIAEQIIRREADKLIAEWLDVVNLTSPYTRRKHVDGFDPTKDVHCAVGSALYSMCYGINERLEDNTEYFDLLLGENPGTELLAIGRQVKI